MQIKVLASSSSGNCYYISDGQTPLLLECGLRVAEIRQKLNFGISRLAGCLISHEHKDHSAAAQAIMDAGVDIYLSHGTMDHLPLRYHNMHVISSGTAFSIGTWRIMPFDTEHDADEPLGFLMANKAGEKLVYATDTAYIRYRFTGLTHIMVEANYSLDILNANVRSGAVPVEMKKRVLRSHMSLDTILDFLKANDLSKVQVIYLLHLSDGNSDAEAFKKRVMQQTGKVVKIA